VGRRGVAGAGIGADEEQTVRGNVFSGPLAGRQVPLRGSGGNSGGNIEWWMYQQTFIPGLLHAQPKMNRNMLGQKQQPAPGVCCQKDARGNTICSDGRGYQPN
jgi:hypothetical protein